MTQSLTLVVTDAGRAALVNAQNTGTDPVLVAKVGLTATAFTASAATAALPGELKQLTTFAGGAVAADTIHVSIRDDSTDTYSLRGFALYLADGTLFASYGQADPIGEKSAQSMLLLALDVIFADIDATALSFGDTNFLLPAATTEQQGIIELATEAEAETGTDATRAMTPATHKGATDARFGAGAPSTFVKSLLTAATAAALRTLLAIKGAALYDTGTGNGLDADLLDGQHGAYYRAWANLTGVPTAFPPAAHQHAWGDITGPPAQATRWADWTEVTNKPATFPPSAHSQDWSTITNPPVQTTRWPAWSEVTAKPAFGTAALTNVEAYATAAQGTRADSAVQPNTAPSLSGVVLSGPAALTGSGFSASCVSFLNTSGNAQTVWIGERFFGAGDLRFVFTTDPTNAAADFFSINTNGTATAASFVTTASSRTVKHDIAPCRYGLAEFLQIPWVEYRYDAAITPDDRLRFGSIVEDVEPVAPLLVIHRKNQVSTFEYDQFIPVIGRALQQYIAANDARAKAADQRALAMAQTLAGLAERVATLEARA